MIRKYGTIFSLFTALALSSTAAYASLAVTVDEQPVNIQQLADEGLDLARRGRGADDAPGDTRGRRGRGADDAPGDDRKGRGRGTDDGPNHTSVKGDDTMQFARRGRGADDAPGDTRGRRGRGADDAPGDDRGGRGRGNDDGPNHT